MDDTVRQHKYLLTEDQIPTTWYNIIPDLPVAPRRRCIPGTKEPVGLRGPRPAVPMGSDRAGSHLERFVEIPGGVLDVPAVAG